MPRHNSRPLPHHRTSNKFFAFLTIAVLLPVVMIVMLGASSGRPTTRTETTQHQQNRRSSSPPLTARDMGYALENLILDFPPSEARNEIHRLMGSREIGYDWKAKNVSAHFVLDPQDDKLQPAFNLAPDFIVKAQASHASRARAQLVLYHEFMHYLQWQDGRVLADLFIREKAAEVPNACMKKWYAELDAYHRECEFAQETGLLNQLDPKSAEAFFCRQSGKTFERVLVEILPRGDASAAACADIWREQLL